MRVPVYLVCAALVVAVRSEEQQQQQAPNYYANPGGGSNNDLGNNNNNNNRFLESLDMVPDQETVSYLLPKLAAKYRPNSEWSGVTDPRFYLLTEMESNNIDNQNKLTSDSRSKRAGGMGENGASLSIVNSLDVLRNRLLLEIARKKAKEGASRNRQILLTLGKRGYYPRSSQGIYGNSV